MLRYLGAFLKGSIPLYFEGEEREVAWLFAVLLKHCHPMSLLASPISTRDVLMIPARLASAADDPPSTPCTETNVCKQLIMLAVTFNSPYALTTWFI